LLTVVEHAEDVIK